MMLAELLRNNFRKNAKSTMVYLYGLKRGIPQRLVATFDSDEQLSSYVGWATLQKNADGTTKFEQGSALSGFGHWSKSYDPLTDDDPDEALHNPSPSML